VKKHKTIHHNHHPRRPTLLRSIRDVPILQLHRQCPENPEAFSGAPARAQCAPQYPTTYLRLLPQTEHSHFNETGSKPEDEMPNRAEERRTTRSIRAFRRNAQSSAPDTAILKFNSTKRTQDNGASASAEQGRGMLDVLTFL
jgi:hypothetical protein